MAGKRIALEHPVERSLDFVFGHFPRHQRTLGQICRQQSLAHAPNRSGPEHGRNAGHDKIDINTRAARDFLERFAHESFDFVLGDGEDFCVDRIVVLDRQHRELIR